MAQTKEEMVLTKEELESSKVKINILEASLATSVRD
jgi:hypothetical protein